MQGNDSQRPSAPVPVAGGLSRKAHAQTLYCSEAQMLSSSLGMEMILTLQNCYVLPVIIDHYLL